MLPASIARRSRLSAGSAIPGRTTSRMTATGSPSATTVRAIVHAGVSAGSPNTSPTSAPRRTWAISSARTESPTPRRSASSE